MKYLLSILLVITMINGYGQAVLNTSCYNGVRDSTEDGVDCYKAGKMGCATCNGTVEITFNGKEYKTGVVRNSGGSIPSQYVFLDKKSVVYNFMISFYKDGSDKSGITLMVMLQTEKFRPQEYRMKGALKSPFRLLVSYNRTGAFMELKRIDKCALTITDVDYAEHLFSGTLEADAELSDGTPLKLSGKLTNVGY